MPSPIEITSPNDPRIAPYRNLKDRELAARQGLFIVEGEHLVHRLLASDYSVASVLLTRQRADRFLPSISQRIPVYLINDHLTNEILGFEFHRGVLASGVRKPSLPARRIFSSWPSRLTLVICPEIGDTENLGAIMRVSAGFGVDALILGESCCDPFARRAIRVSMGTVFRARIAQSTNLLQDLRWLKEEQGVRLVAAVADRKAEPLAHSTRPEKLGLLLGHEERGLGQKWLDVCDRRVSIPMQLETDSLNVAVAAGIFLYHFVGKASTG